MGHDTDGIWMGGKSGELEVQIRALCLAGLEEIRRWYLPHSRDDYYKVSTKYFPQQEY